ncbi:MAG: alanine racemase [Halobacteriovoraceae bacterium]|nr:alanine racemase [Halobacteriovoraceae bacterium]
MSIQPSKKLKYERPNIVRVSNYLTSKAGPAIAADLEFNDVISGISVEELSEKYGSPLFVFCEKTIRDTYRRAHKAFCENYENVQFAWSYKTNYLKGICAIFHQEGAIAEVVSDFEYEKARALGVPGNRIIYNGPLKSVDSLKRAIRERAYIHIDNFDEMTMIEEIARKEKIIVPVAIRLNFHILGATQWSRFGFNLETGQALEAARKIISSDHLELTGIHAHIGTFMMDPTSYEQSAEKLIDFYLMIQNKFGVRLHYIDMGGGIPSKNNLRGVYQPAEIAIKNIEEYASCITKKFKIFENSEHRPKLILETGRHLIDEAGFLITQVSNSKLLPTGKRSYVLDAGVNLLYTNAWYNFKFQINKKLEGIAEPAIFNGPLCMNIDILKDGFSTPYIPVGTHITLHPVGAYNITQSMQFIRYRPAVVLIKENGETCLLKRAENLESIEFDELLPDELKFEL